MPAIMELLGVSFAFYRIFSKIYAGLENVFSGEPASLAEAEQLLYEGEKLVGDIIQTINNITQQNWQVPTSLSNNELIEYLPNSAFSFYPAICLKIKQLNLDSIKTTLRLAKEIIKAAKNVIDLQFEQEHELNELQHNPLRYGQIITNSIKKMFEVFCSFSNLIF